MATPPHIGDERGIVPDLRGTGFTRKIQAHDRIAMDATTRQIIAFHVGDRSRASGKELWAPMPTVSREQAMFHTDQYEVYQGVIPAEQHRAMTKNARKTNHI